MTTYSARLLANLRLFVLAALAAVFLGALLGTGLVIFNNRTNALENAARGMESLALVLSKEADSTLTLAETVLDGIIAEHLQDSGYFSNPEDLHRDLKKHRDILLGDGDRPSFAHMFITGADGHTVANTVSHPPQRVDASDREYFQYHRDTPGTQMRISQPKYSRVTQERVIFLTKRLENATGVFLGVIGLHLKLRHFDQLYSLLQLPPGGTVTVIRDDGWGIYRYPMADVFFEKSTRDLPGFKNMMARRAGHWTGITSPYDNTVRVAGFYVSDKYNMLNIISVTQTSVLEGWIREAAHTALIALAGSLVIVLGGLFSHRQLGHLIYALQLSSIDSLTGIGNRRAFDDRLDEEWRRAERGGASLSLLFVDVDFFKLYNDTYGHRAGDKCLKAIARVLEKGAARGGEFAARYGGEEFVILLPNASTEDVEKTASHLIALVAEQKIPHSASAAAPHVTVSIGGATMTPTTQASMDDLVERADEALYKAKEGGRNRYVAHPGETNA
ncbi:MAG: GGDEF domain-containing protein [Alphaproteobacteria bacterium]|nr:GGDEF domain-containing protein [Alphaproteobacteria bacterium]MBF0251479.1 GGDEF domain-containing protein [Alphaproteobacteria bacterium]